MACVMCSLRWKKKKKIEDHTAVKKAARIASRRGKYKEREGLPRKLQHRECARSPRQILSHLFFFYIYPIYIFVVFISFHVHRPGTVYTYIYRKKKISAYMSYLYLFSFYYLLFILFLHSRDAFYTLLPRCFHPQRRLHPDVGSHYRVKKYLVVNTLWAWTKQFKIIDGAIQVKGRWIDQL